jgi:hypothetical protein
MLFVMPLVWVVLGASLLAAGLGIRNEVEPVAGWPQTTGWIAGFHTYWPSYEKGPTYIPVIAFRAAGHVVMFSAPGLSDPPMVGAPARVTYEPRNPADARDLSMGSDGDGQIYLGIGFLVLGVALMAFLYWLVFVRPKSARWADGTGTAPSEGRHVRSR